MLLPVKTGNDGSSCHDDKNIVCLKKQGSVEL